MNSKNVNNYENVVIRKEQEIGINNFGLEYLVSLEQEIERLNTTIQSNINSYNKLAKYNSELEDRIDKAIEYIDHCIFDYEENTMIGEDFKIVKRKLLGSDKE